MKNILELQYIVLAILADQMSNLFLFKNINYLQFEILKIALINVILYFKMYKVLVSK